MRLLLISYLLLHPYSTLAATPPALTIQLTCLDAWEGTNLEEDGGGPMGAQWNTTTVVCVARIHDLPGDDVQSVHLRLAVGQGKDLTSVGEIYIPAHPRRLLSMGEPSQVEAIRAAALPERTFFIPPPLLMRALRQKSRQPATGAEVYRLHFLLTARGLDAKGGLVVKAQDEVKSEFAFGE